MGWTTGLKELLQEGAVRTVSLNSLSKTFVPSLSSLTHPLSASPSPASWQQAEALASRSLGAVQGPAVSNCPRGMPLASFCWAQEPLCPVALGFEGGETPMEPQAS